MEKLSVIIPVYKVEPYLRECLDSVIGQTYQNMEIIVIDDGSPDGCGMICDEYAAKDKRITVIHKENEGLSAARNQGIRMATGQWITFMDSDDWLERDFYEKLMNMANDHSGEVDIVTSSGRIMEGKQRWTLHSFEGVSGMLDTKDPDELLCIMLKPGSSRTTNICVPWDKIYRLDYVRSRSAYFQGKAHEDIWFNTMIFDQNPRTAVSPIIGYHYRVVATSISHNYNPDKPKINYAFLKELVDFLKARTTDGQLSPRLYDVMMARTLVYIGSELNCCYFHAMNPQSYRENARQIKERKRLPIYAEAIRTGHTSCMNRNQKVLKLLLRLPWIWPLRFAYAVKARIMR